MKWLAAKEKKQRYMLALAAMAIAAAFFYQQSHQEKSVSHALPLPSEEPEQKEQKEQDSKQQDQPETIVVDVKGAVVHPGVYEMLENARVNDVIARAGGLTTEADQTKINLAAKAYDEMMIYVPSKGETSMPISPPEEKEENKVDINHATQEEIEQLKGIGPAKAAAIIAYREENGPFKKAEDLLNVSGIGEKSLESLKAQIMIR